MKKLLVILLLLATTAQASVVSIVPKDPSLFERMGVTFQRCTWRITCYFSNPLGASITTINGTDRLTDSRTVINDNFSSLNTFKVENSTTSVASITTLANLSTVGTITSGVWNGTAIPVLYGGTGSTSPTTNMVMLGNGSSGFKVVTGFGSLGQLLVSNGANTAPTWQSPSVDTSIDYAWTGNHNFTGTVRTKSLNASSTAANPIVLNGVSLNTPATQGAASTTLMNDGSGNLVWTRPDFLLMASTTLTANTSTSTVTIPVQATDLVVKVRVILNGTGGVNLQLNGDTGNNYGYAVGDVDAAQTQKASTNIIRLTDTVSATGVTMAFTIHISADTGQQKFLYWTGARGQVDTPPIAIAGGGAYTGTGRVTSISIGGQTSGLGVGTRISVYASNL